MRRGALIALWLLAAAAGLLFVGLVLVPWLAFFGTVAVPGLHFDQVRPSLSAADVAGLTVAGCTGLLALVTALLAVTTRRAVVEAQRERKVADDALRSIQDHLEVAHQQVAVGQNQVEASNRHTALAQRAFEVSFRPLLADVPRGFRSYSDGGRSVEVVRDQFEHIEDESQVVTGADYGKPGYYSVALRNVGSGPAIVTGVRLQAGGVAWTECTISAAVVPPGEVSRFTFTIPADRDEVLPIRDEILRSTAMLVVVGYTDQAGLHEMRTEAHLSRYRHAGGVSPWYVRQLATFDGDGELPVVMSAPSDPHGIPR
jgi:hypothetical protein